MHIVRTTIVLLFFTAPAMAAFNANMQGTPDTVIVYTDGDYIYFSLTNQPTSHPQCNPAFFVIHGTIPLERRQMLLSRLLMAKSSDEVITIGYDSLGDCADGYIRVHRVG